MDTWELLDAVDILPKLPANLVEQLESKKWQERRDVLQSVLDQLKANPKLDPKAQYGEIIDNLKKVLEKDSNINVQALAAQCILGFAAGLRKKFAPFAPLVTSTIFERFKEKKPLLRDPLIECIDMIAANTTLDKLSDDIMEAMPKSSPNIKIQMDMFLYRSFKAYNAQTLPKKFLKDLAPLIVKHTFDSDPEVREAAYAALGSAMRTIGEKPMMTLLTTIADDKFKIVKITDMRDKAAKEVIEELSQQVAVVGNNVVPASEEKSTIDQPVAVQPEIDTWELLDAVDILPKLPANLVEQLESKKWQERRDVLQLVLDQLKENPKLDPKAQYGEIIDNLKKVLEKDSNINVQALAAQCILGFASGLRKKFAPFTSLVTSTIFERFKEKKPLLRDPLIKCIDMIAAHTTLDKLSDDIMEAMQKSSPNIKIQTDMFLYRSFMAYNAQTLPKKFLKDLAPLIVKHTFDSDPEVREAAYAALGSAMRTIGEKSMMTLLTAIADDKLKITKITDMRDKAAKEVHEDLSQQVAVVSNNVVSVSDKKSTIDQPAIVLASNEKSKFNQPVVVQPEVDTWELLDAVDILPKLPANLVEQFESKKWQERRDVLQSVLDQLKANPKLDPKAQYGEIIDNLKKVLEKDSNINVQALAAQCILGFAAGLRKKFAPFAPLVTSTIFERFKEKKPLLRDPLIECIDMIAANTTLDKLSDDIMEAMPKSSPNIKIQMDMFLYRSFKAYNAQTLPKKFLKDLAPLIVKHTFDSDPEVREAAYAALGSAMRTIGEKPMMTLLTAIADDKFKIVKITDMRDKAAKEVHEDLSQKATVTGNNVVSASGAKSTIDQSFGVQQEIDTWELLEAVDILPKLPKNLDEQLESKKWQERRDALQSVLDQLKANPKLDPKAQYGEIINNIKKILEKDSNINVLALAAQCILGFAAGLRKKFAPFAPLVTSAIFERFKEKKPLLRDPLIECIDTIAANTTLDKLSDDIMEAMPKSSPNIKIQTDMFLYRSFKAYNAQTLPKKLLKDLAPLIVKHTFDSDPEVREAAYAALGSAMRTIGEKPMMTLIKTIADDKLKISKIMDMRDKAAKEVHDDLSQKVTMTGNNVVSGEKSTMDQPMQMNQQMVDFSVNKGANTRTGAFQIDYELFSDDNLNGQSTMPYARQLIDHSEVDEILEQKISLPPLSSRLASGRPLSPTRRTPSMTSVSSMDASVTIDSVINQVGSANVNSAIQALLQLDDLAKDADKAMMLAGRVDQLLTVLFFQFRLVHNTHLADDNFDKQLLIKVYRGMCALLLSLVNVSQLSREASELTIKDLIFQLLTVLRDERLTALNEGSQVIRSVNLITVKLVERCDPTACFIALTRLLRETLSSDLSSTNFQELVMKCIWKQSRLIPQLIDQMQLNKVLYESHCFFAQYSAETLRDKPQDMPLRTIKTVLNAITRVKGDSILDHVGMIPEVHKSQAIAYVKKCLRDTQRQNQQQPQLPGQPSNSGPISSTVLSDVGNRGVHSDATYSSSLAEIFKMIANKENSKQGVQQLYEFMQSHPGSDAQVQEHLRSSSSFFKSYVENSLTACAENDPKNAAANPTTTVVSNSQPAACLGRLQEIRLRIGLAPVPVMVKNSSEVVLPPIQTETVDQVADDNGDKSKDESRPKWTRTELDSIKRRLEQVKQCGTQL